MIGYSKLLDEFSQRFGSGKSEAGIYFAPECITFMGISSVHNSGHVLSSALDLGTYCIIHKSTDNKFKFALIGSDTYVELEENNLGYEKHHGWANYPKAVINSFRKRGYDVKPVEILFYSEVISANNQFMSSSIELSMAKAIDDIFKNDISPTCLATMSKQSENEFLNINLGIREQFISAIGKKDNAILLDTESLRYQYIPMKLDNISIALVQTNIKGFFSTYERINDRLDILLNILKAYFKIDSLSQLKIGDIEKVHSILKNQHQLKIVEHIISENARVFKSANALEGREVDAFAELMNESQLSIKDKLGITSSYLEDIINPIMNFTGVLSYKFVNIGLDAFVVVILENEKIYDFEKHLSKEIINKLNFNPRIFIPKIGDGAARVMLG